MKSNPAAEDAWRFGSLPEEAPLAAAYIPRQRGDMPRYETMRALARGTLFPGLDLPFMNLVNPDGESTPKTELMAIDFVCDELELYLDTHPEDREAFELYQAMLTLQREARERYLRLCGPIGQSDLLGMERYAWLDAPWPWELCVRGEG